MGTEEWTVRESGKFHKRFCIMATASSVIHGTAFGIVELNN